MGRNRTNYHKTPATATREEKRVTSRRYRRKKESAILTEFKKAVGGAAYGGKNRGNSGRARTITLTLPGRIGSPYYSAAESWAFKIQQSLDTINKSSAVKSVPVPVPDTRDHGAGLTLPKGDQLRSVCAMLIKKYCDRDQRLRDLHTKCRKMQLTDKQVSYALGILKARKFISQELINKICGNP